MSSKYTLLPPQTCVLITGVGGLLGSNLARWITENKPNVKIVGIDDLSGGYREYIPKQVHFYRLDLTTAHSELDQLFEYHHFDYIFHFAAYAAEGLSPFMRKFNYTSNVLATAELINLSIKYGTVKRFVYTSSMAVYGKGEQEPPFSEELVPAPEDPYGIAKYACEMDLKAATRQHNLEFCIIRPHNVYGPQQNIWDRYRNVLGIWMYQLTAGEPITIYGDGEQTRAFSYIEDSLEPLWKAAVDPRAKNEIINLGGTKPVSLREALELLKKVVGTEKQVEVKYLEPRYEVKHAHSTHEKSVGILDYIENTNMEEGLRKMWEWVKTQPTKPRKKWENYELNRGIYSYWK